MQNIEIFKVGYCTHPEFMVLKGGGFKSIKFPAMAALIKHKKANILFDTGYSKHFFEATKTFPEKLYALITPVSLEKSLNEKLDADIEYIFISHFHADHIGGLKDFPNSKIFCSKKAHEMAISRLSRFSKTRQGVLPKLLPKDFNDRVIYIEDLPKLSLPNDLHPFTSGYEILDGVYAIELKGHAVGHFGLFTQNHFFISDAVWDMRAISKNIRPNILTNIILSDAKQYHETIDKLQALHKNSPHIKIIPTHCSNSLDRYLKEESV